MTTKQLIELLSQFDPESIVAVEFPDVDNYGHTYRTEWLHVEEFARYDGIHPLISVNGAHLLEA